MPKVFYLFLLLIVTSFSVRAQKTSSSLLPTGHRFPAHHEIIGYLDEISKRYSTTTRKITYGTTYEQKPLNALIISAPENIRHLEDIRVNHLTSLGLQKATIATKTTVPIAWLSYNVHGNEAATASAAIRVIEALLDSTNTASQKILQNVVVIIDPCANPDGYDRYVHWYTQTKGKFTNSLATSREHQEPWPGGRYNHYLFDLNRDWAWQIQKESQARIAFYQQWMPHIHADFHEMYSNSTYYFPPAAKPYHQDITDWQRKFNDILGQYNSKEFDKHGWLYFTRQSFDLFYPSYGDTWPIYNGAIGMTYEQAGSGLAGLALARPNEGDTLTLEDRITHHVTASFATLAATTDYKEQLITELIQFYQQAQKKPIGEYKSYIIQQQPQGGSIVALKKLLDSQGITYGTVTKATEVKGYNLATHTLENTIEVAPNDLVISAYQPKSGLLKILLEPQPELEDSLTYDITTWSLAYAYGVKAFGTSSQLKISPLTPISKAVITPNAYAYLIPWQSYEAVQALSYLHQHRIKVRSSLQPFRLEGKKYAAGTLIITKQGNEAHLSQLPRHLQTLADSLQLSITSTSTGFVEEGLDLGSNAVSALHPPRVVVAAGHQVNALALGEVWHFFDEQIQYPVSLINTQQWSTMPWKEMDVLILPAGHYQTISQERDLFTLKNWIKGGGKLILLENAITSFVGKNEFLIEKKNYRPTPTLEADQPLFGNKVRDGLRNETSGSVFQVTLDTTHPLAFGYPSFYYSLVKENHGLSYLSEGWNVGRLEKDSYKAGFVGKNLREKLKETLIIGSQPLGNGEIIYLADNPLFRGFWYQGKLLFANAVFR